MLAANFPSGAVPASLKCMRVLFDALRALIYATGFVLLWGWIALGVRPYDTGLGIVLPAWTVMLGVLSMLIGGICVVLCVGTFVIWGRGTPAPFDAPRQFVSVGPYKYVRNPMYIGAWMVLLGCGLYLRSFSILILSLASLVLAHLFVILYEERDLRDRFGASYEEYCNSVPRWIPTVPRTKQSGRD
jgi:protein-S-isoprenylcysteine O-methyltransferase Ste14